MLKGVFEVQNTSLDFQIRQVFVLIKFHTPHIESFVIDFHFGLKFYQSKLPQIPAAQWRHAGFSFQSLSAMNDA